MAAYPDEDCIADEIKGRTFIPKTLSVLLETIIGLGVEVGHVNTDGSLIS